MPAGIVEREAVEDRPLVAVREADVVEADVRSLGNARGVADLDDDRLGVEHVDDAARGGGAALQRADALADRPQRVDEQREVEVEERERADRDLAGRSRGALPYQSTTRTPISGSASSAGRKTASTAATSERGRTTSSERRAEARGQRVRRRRGP